MRHTCASDGFARDDLAAAFRAEYLAAQATMMFPFERGEFYAAFEALFRFGIGHPELCQIGVLVVRERFLFGGHT